MFSLYISYLFFGDHHNAALYFRKSFVQISGKKHCFFPLIIFKGVNLCISECINVCMLSMLCNCVCSGRGGLVGGSS